MRCRSNPSTWGMAIDKIYQAKSLILSLTWVEIMLPEAF